MKHSVQRKNLDFLSNGMSEPDGVLPRNVGGDGDFAGQAWSCARFRTGESRRKRQHVGGLILVTKLAVQRAHGGTAGDEHIHRGREADGLSRAQYETLQRVCVQSRDALLQNNQVFLFGRVRVAAQKQTGGPSRGPPAQCVLLYPLASAAVDFASLAAAAACFSALAASACLGSASKSICCSATRVLCSS